MYKMPLWIDESYLSVSKREDSMICRLSEIFYNLLYILIYSRVCTQFNEWLCVALNVVFSFFVFVKNTEISFAFLARLLLSLSRRSKIFCTRCKKC